MVGGLKKSSWGGEAWQGSERLEDWVGEVVAGGPGGPTFACREQLGGTTGERDRPFNPGFQHGEIKPQTLWL